jgi:hypothetical protein
MRVAHLFVASFAAALLSAPAIADPHPPIHAPPPCPGVQPGEQVLTCAYIPFARSHRGAYDADPAAYYYPTYREEVERAEWSDDRRERFYREEHVARFNSIDLDAFARSYSSDFRDSGWRQQDAGGWRGDWVEDRGPADRPRDDR